MEIAFNVLLDLLLVPHQQMVLLVYKDISYLHNGLLVLNVHLQLLPVTQLQPFNHVYQPSMLHQLQDLMLPVLHVQLLEMLLNVTMLIMLQDVNQDITHSMELVLNVQPMLNHVMDYQLFNVKQDSSYLTILVKLVELEQLHALVM